ncbi:RNA polymerase sigma factor SigZ [Flavobacterium chungangensis]|uniref:RNA polymerase sigma factor SigZ n=1 Tax=Flavobacterium chungangensis TaxID=2708132 RepID=A0ABV8ZJX7_9FLAO
MSLEINTIHNQFYIILGKYIKARINDTGDASDVLQEVFIKINENLGSLTEESKLKSWIFTITRNSIIDYYRKNSNHKKSELTECMMQKIMHETDFDTSESLDCCLMKFIERLPEDYRDIIMDSEIHGIKQKNLTEKYSLAYASIRSRVQRGRSKLKEMLLDCCSIELDRRGNVMNVTSKKSCSGGKC